MCVAYSLWVSITLLEILNLYHSIQNIVKLHLCTMTISLELLSSAVLLAADYFNFPPSKIAYFSTSQMILIWFSFTIELRKCRYICILFHFCMCIRMQSLVFPLVNILSSFYFYQVWHLNDAPSSWNLV